jgi:hypothetical protein
MKTEKMPQKEGLLIPAPIIFQMPEKQSCERF